LKENEKMKSERRKPVYIVSNYFKG